MEKEQRNRLQKATQDARRLLEEEFRSQLLQTYDIDVDRVRWAEEPGTHLQAEQRLIRDKLVAWIEHKETQINDRKEALLLALREMAFTALNRFVALKLMEARELVRPCVSGGLESEGFLEFTAVAQGLLADQESSYRLYLETIFEDVSRELRALFDPRDPASLLWPKRAALLELLEILNRPELSELWIEDETLGWVYQYFNGDAERKKMREESSAPRNSRELAVRNQFFTPRYVVEFLTDNTLGRIWYEMRQGNTGLKDQCRYLVLRPNEVWLQPGEEPPAQADADEALSQEELLRQPVHISHRPLKDPREIRMLDPACGSMHFGLYAFDLYLEIYSEAWEIAKASEEQAQQGDAFVPFVAYAAGFTDKVAFLREVPSLILQHNIHGIDIDTRATQIARLTLWLRAQRAWQEQQLGIADRPPITRSNVASAEPMPGEKELLADFVDQQFPEEQRGLFQQLLESIFDKMQLAGEAGSLLRIEEEIRDVIDKARADWKKLGIQQSDLFGAPELAELGRLGASLRVDLQGLTKDFWIGIEERIYIALRNYADQAETVSSFQRRLFAEDAAQGFAFVDICRKRYDVALMNPPFGLECPSTTHLLRTAFENAYNDMFSCFIARGFSMASGGLLGAITSRSFLIRRRQADFRKEWILPTISSLLDLGIGVMDDAMVQSCAFILDHGFSSGRPLVFDWRSMNEVNISSITLKREKPIVFCTHLAAQIPFHRIIYSLPPGVIALFNSSRAFEPIYGFAKEGMKTFDNVRFLRLSWEIRPVDIGFPVGWVRFAKGGEVSPYHGPVYLLLNRRKDGKELNAVNFRVNGSTSQVNQASSVWGRPGCTYSRRSKYFAARALPASCVFSDKGPAVLTSSKISPDLLLAWLNSAPVRAFVHLQANASDYLTGIIKTLPFPRINTQAQSAIEELGAALARHKRRIHMTLECDPEFIPYKLESDLAYCSQKQLAYVANASSLMLEAEAKVSELVAQLYGFNDITWSSEILSDDIDDEVDSEEIEIGPGMGYDANSLRNFASDVLSFIVGTVFGRWDIQYATADNTEQGLANPFAALPVCPPGQLKNDQGLPAEKEDVPPAYPVEIPWDGILVDDPNHPLDIRRRVREALEIIWSGQESGPTAEGIEQEACDILGVQSLRDYLRKPAGFFAEHLKRYSKSRRQAPIYWPLSAGSGSYSAWLYYHRLTQDTLYLVLRDFVEPRIQQAERDQFELESQGSLPGEAANQLQKTQTLLQDLRIFKRELDLVAPLWNPNLNDGVIINHAILWRITPYTPWQKKCKECWDKLVKGDYDWAHLAFHLWPERVIPNCTTDRSLAIAHGLEDRLWQETNNGNWLPRQLSEADLQALIAEHSNPAVKSALERFLAAPPPVAPTRARASRSTRASGSSTPRRARGTAAVVDAEATRQVLLALTAAPSEGLAKAAIADLIGVEANALTAVIKQLKESGQIDQLGERRGARYLLSEQGRAAVASQAGDDD
jgi:hypothetical protein